MWVLNPAMVNADEDVILDYLKENGTRGNNLGETKALVDSYNYDEKPKILKMLKVFSDPSRPVF
jgi:hypothetical protein